MSCPRCSGTGLVRLYVIQEQGPCPVCRPRESPFAGLNPGPGEALLVHSDGSVSVVEDPHPDYPRIGGLVLRPAVVDALRAAQVACVAHGLTLNELLARAELALARWPEVLPAYEIPDTLRPAEMAVVAADPDEVDGWGGAR